MATILLLLLTLLVVTPLPCCPLLKLLPFLLLPYNCLLRTKGRSLLRLLLLAFAIEQFVCKEDLSP